MISHRSRRRPVHHADYHETYRHENRRDPESGSSSPSLAEEEDVDSAGDELLGSEEAGDEEVLGAAADEHAEDLGGEVG